MKIGVIFPQTEIGNNPDDIRAYSQAVEEMGYQYLVAYDHVVGADPASRENWAGIYSHKDAFHEPFALFGYIAALTTKIELVTGILILPQRQTVLVAKQAAEVDVLSGGRMRLGVAVGWNDVEFEALGENFHNRGRRIEEQTDVLRALWKDDVITFHGKWHDITEAGINPMPIQRPIPLWFGGGRNETVVRRIARLGDGWFPQIKPDDSGQKSLDDFREFVVEYGRDISDVGIQTVVTIGRDPNQLENGLQAARTWDQMGVTHVSVNTMRGGFSSVDQHISALEKFKRSWEG